LHNFQIGKLNAKVDRRKSHVQPGIGEQQCIRLWGSKSSGLFAKPTTNNRARLGLQVATSMKNTRNRALLFFLITSFAWLSSCGQKAKDDCAKNIGQAIRQGDSIEEAQSKLKDCGFKVTLDTKKSTLYGDKVKEGIPVSERTEVVIQYDSNKKVTEVQIGGGLIGP
jgi:hypothetical protein